MVDVPVVRPSRCEVLDGGLKKWLREGRPTHSGKVTPKPGKFKATFDPSRVRSQQQLIANLETPCRASGRCASAAALRGHASPSRGRAAARVTFPAAATCPMPNLFDAATGAMKPLEELRRAFTGAGVDMTKPIVTTCGSGVSALVLTLALYRLGVATPRSMTARGRNGVCRTARRSRPGRPDQL